MNQCRIYLLQHSGKEDDIQCVHCGGNVLVMVDIGSLRYTVYCKAALFANKLWPS